MSTYNQTYHTEIEESARQSAGTVIRMLISMLNPQSVVDVGCGRGTWLMEWQQQGIKDFLGIDGAHQDKNKLLIGEEYFREYDLNTAFHSNRRFDIATCMEVVEHLRPDSADTIIQTLTQLSDIIVFSAAVPNQGGFKHINEQWPYYWAKKFEALDYVFLDAIRWKLLTSEKVSWWYRQNLFLVVKRNKYEQSFQTFPIYSPEFYLMHRHVYKVSTNLFNRLLFLIQQFVYNHFHSFHHRILPFIKKILNRK